MGNPLPMIRVQHLTKRFLRPGKPELIANKDISFQVPRGTIFGILGPNGAGKTTLVHQVLGLLTPSSGTILIDDINVATDPAAIKGRVGFLPQAGIPMRWIEVERALYYTGRLRHQSDSDARQQTEWLIDQLDLSAIRRRHVHRLSGGMQRVVNVAMALMGWPPVLLLDEPTNELDPSRRRRIWELIQRLNRERGTTCLLVTHNILEAEQVIQQVLILQGGQVVALGTPGELKQRIGAQIRLAFRTADDHPLDSAIVSALARHGQVATARPGFYTVLMNPDEVAAVTDLMVQQVGLDHLDDFRLAPLSLEDVYFQLESAQSQDGSC